MFDGWLFIAENWEVQIWQKDFSFELLDYCSYCGDFEPDIEKEEVTSLGEKACAYMTTIKCGNAYKCARICENMRVEKQFHTGYPKRQLLTCNS